MVKRCSWGTCNTDSRYPERLTGVTFRPFPKPKTNMDRCLRWIKLCGRPRNQLNIDILRNYGKAKHLYVCSKHFREGQVDPVPALPCDRFTPRRPSPKRRRSEPLTAIPVQDVSKKTDLFRVTLEGKHVPCGLEDLPTCTTTSMTNEKDVQTDDIVIDGDFQKLEVLALAAENKRLTEEYSKLVLEYENELRKNATQKITASSPSQTYQTISTSTLDKDSFQYYTGFSHERFFDLFNFLVPDSEAPFKLSKNLNCFSHIPYQDQLLFVLMKLRQDFDFKHLSFLFGISSQDCSTLFSVWVNYMYHQLGSLVIWPHRDVIISKMPQQFKEDFPNTMVIIDGTEVKVQRPSSLNRQSQCYSDYKSCTTLKGLVGVDPRGSVIFASMLFTGSISDKELTSRCGFYDTIKSLLDNGKLKKGYCVMADKGFTINDEIKNLGLMLNILPFVPMSANQMKAADVTETIKIAQHRVHVERAISRIKQFKILANKVPLSLFSSINPIWLVCCLLTNFMPFLIQESANEPGHSIS